MAAVGPGGFPLPGRGYVLASKLLGGTMVFWVLYRGKKDLPVLLGMRHPWEHHGHQNHNQDNGHDGAAAGTH